ncbi:MAG: translation initiation factor IF-2 [Deltaproteobacteria bacterium]|nr:translation initiation factor IF-2 [Deltaproteobacteria bacterium]
MSSKKVKVYEFAKQLNLSSKELLAKLQECGFKITTHMAALSSEQIDAVQKRMTAEIEVKSKRDQTIRTRIEQREEGSVAVEEQRVQPTIIRRRRRMLSEAEAEVEGAIQSAIQKIEEERGVDLPSEEEEISSKKEEAPAEPRGRVSEPQKKTAISIEEMIEQVKPREEAGKGEPKRVTLVRKKTAKELQELIEREKDELAKKTPLRRRAKRDEREEPVVVVPEEGEEPVLPSEKIVYIPAKKAPTVMTRPPRKTEITIPKASKRIIRMQGTIMVRDLAIELGVKAGEILKKLMNLGIVATLNDTIDADAASLVAHDYQYEIQNIVIQEADLLKRPESKAEHRIKRPPVVTVMGHVDHGKTSLLDYIRKTRVAAGEAGGITQHIGAYQISVGKDVITFIDTPGHEAFTAMRARGAKCTDIVILVVAADDGVMPQTVEAIDHAKAANVPIIVAINKIDKPQAAPDRVKQELSSHGVIAEDWGGNTIMAPVSALKGTGIPELLELIALQAEMLELKGDSTLPAKGIVLEARIDRGRGPVADILIQEGTLKTGDIIVCGTCTGKVRAMMDDHGNPVREAFLSMPVEILGLSDVPQAGSLLYAVKNEEIAKEVADLRLLQQKAESVEERTKVTLENFFEQVEAEGRKELKLILKGDVQGSIEALRESLRKCQKEDIHVNVIHSGVGVINENDVNLAAASEGVVIGFHVGVDTKAKEAAERQGVDIKTYSIIYEAVEEVQKALEGMLEPKFEEQILGRAEVRSLFHVSKVGTIAGSMVLEGKIKRGSLVRLMRGDEVVFEGKLSSVKRFKEDVREVAEGYECGIAIENFKDLKEGDVIISYEMAEKK